jgi:hypothetical protein
VVLAIGGEVHVTIKDSLPYSEWGIEGLASNSGFVLTDTKAFHVHAYPGYQHQTTQSDARDMDVTSKDALKLLKTLVFKRKKKHF